MFFTFYANPKIFVFAEKWNLWSIIAMSLFFLFHSLPFWILVTRKCYWFWLSLTLVKQQQQKKRNPCLNPPNSVRFCSFFFHLHFMLLVTLILIVWLYVFLFRLFFPVYLFWLSIFLWLWPHSSLTSVANEWTHSVWSTNSSLVILVLMIFFSLLWFWFH